MLASSAQPRPPHLLSSNSTREAAAANGRPLMSAVPSEVVADDRRVAPPKGRMKGLFSRSKPTAQATSPTSPVSSLSPSLPAENEQRSRLKAASSKVRGLGHGFPSAASSSSNGRSFSAPNGHLNQSSVRGIRHISSPVIEHNQPPPVPARSYDLGQSLGKASQSTPMLLKNPSRSDLRDDADGGKKRKGGRHSLAVLFHTMRYTSNSSRPDELDEIEHTEVINEKVEDLQPPPGPRVVPHSHSLQEPPSRPALHLLANRSLEHVATPRVASRPPSLTRLRPMSRPSSSSALRPDSARRVPSAGTLHNSVYRYGDPSSNSSLSPALGMTLSQSSFEKSRTSLLNGSRTSLSLSQTSLILPESNVTRSQLLSKDHYHLRFATTYIISLITPALRTANFSKSERNLEIKRISEDRLGLLARMERTWGSSWAEAAADLLHGTQASGALEVKEARLRACNITATAKARERKVFATAIRDGILLCFLFNRLFPSQPAHIQRVKVPKDEARIAANIDRFLSACREMGVPESEMFNPADIDENSPAGLACVARTIQILAEMSGPGLSPRPRIPSTSSKRSENASSPSASKTPSRAGSPPLPQHPLQQQQQHHLAVGRSLGPGAGPPRALHERPLRSSSSDLLARLQRESTTSSTSAASSSLSQLGPASSSLPQLEGIPSSKAMPTARASQTFSVTPPISPVRAVGTPSTPARSTSGTQQPTPPTARPQIRTMNSKAQVSFAQDTGSPRVSGPDWSSSISSNHSAHHLSPLHERERTPSLVSNNSQVASSYSRSSMSGVPTIMGDDRTKSTDALDEFGLLDNSPSVPETAPHPRRLSEQTLQEARRKIIGTLMTSTEDLSLPARETPRGSSSLEEQRGLALSGALAALEGSRNSFSPVDMARSDSPRLRPISRGARTRSIEVQRVNEEDEGGQARSGSRPVSEVPPRPRIRRPSVNGKMYVPKRPQSPASPAVSLYGSAMLSPVLPVDPSSRDAFTTGRVLSKEERRRSEDFPSYRVASAGRIMNMRNHSMVNLPSNRRTSNLSQGSRDSMLNNPSLQVLDFCEPGQPTIRYQLGNCIGRGQFGSVYRSLHLSSGQMVAIKRIRLSGMKENEVRDVMREVELLKRLTHPGIVKYEGMSRDDQYLNIVLEFVENGSLGQTLRAFGKFNERLIVSYVAKILEGLTYLHSEGVVHCDLKAANILSTKNGNIKLSDFGVSLNMRAVENFAERASIGRTEGMKANEIAGTPNWMAPEIIKLAGASPASDIWSLGCTIIELLTGKPPYSDVGNSMTVLFRIVEDPMPPLPETSPELTDFLKLCFIKEPSDRPSAKLLSEHDWVRAGMYDLANRPQDSLPFIHRRSGDPTPRRMNSQQIFIPDPQARSASASCVDLSASIRSKAPEEVSKRAQMSMVSLHSHLWQSKEVLDTAATKTHALVKTNFAKSITCHVCLDGVKKSAYLCQNCGLITHAKCARRAHARCDVREQLSLLANQQDRVSVSSSHGNSPYPNEATHSGPSSLLSSLPARLLSRNRSKASFTQSSTSLVEPASIGRRRYSSGAASSGSRPVMEPAFVSMSGTSTPGPDTMSSLRSRHSETSEDGSSAPRDRSTSLIRIDEDEHIQRKPAVRVMEPPLEGGPSRNRQVMRRHAKEMKENKGECVIA